MNPKISVIIPVKNEEIKIQKCLKAVFDQSLQPFEVIVVDGHSGDLTVENVKKFPVKIFYEDYRTRAGANKVGIDHAEGEYIAFTDADCIPDKYWLSNLYKELKPGIAGVGGSIINLGEGLWEKSINVVFDSFLGSANSIQGRLFSKKKFVKSISGCNSLYRKTDLLKSGGFNVTLTTAEDTDLNNKMLKIGKLLYTPDAIIHHDHRRGLKGFKARMFQYGYGRAKSKLWDLQVIPPIVLIILVISVFLNPLFLLAAISLYIIILILSGIYFSIKFSQIEYLISIPIVYFVEHFFYCMGYYKGLFSLGIEKLLSIK
ncbi:MAG: glycosyltransferase [Methanomicrobiales archaeon]|nr:glycosyltransferase [Methanomicrobiales archaeon]